MENIITVTSTESRIEASIEALKSDVKFVLFDMMKVLRQSKLSIRFYFNYKFDARSLTVQ